MTRTPSTWCRVCLRKRSPRLNALRERWLHWPRSALDVTDLGQGPRKGVPGGVRRIPLLVDGWFYALPLPRLRLIAITRVIPPFSDL